MNEPIIHIAVIDPKDQQSKDRTEDYIQWLTRTDRKLTEAQKPFIPLKPRVTRENLYNL